MLTPGPWELIIILLIVLIIFGAGKLPEIGSGLGKGIRNFKKATTGKEEIDVTPPASPTESQASQKDQKEEK
jgi:sec-independent protein translocase protein TatA